MAIGGSDAASRAKPGRPDHSPVRRFKDDGNAIPKRLVLRLDRVVEAHYAHAPWGRLSRHFAARRYFHGSLRSPGRESSRCACRKHRSRGVDAAQKRSLSCPANKWLCRETVASSPYWSYPPCMLLAFSIPIGANFCPPRGSFSHPRCRGGRRRREL